MSFIGNFFNRIANLVTPNAMAAKAPETGGVAYTLVRLLGSGSTLALIAGTDSNFSLSGTNLVVASAIPVGSSQTAVVRESLNSLALEYPVTLTRVAATPTPTPVATSNVKRLFGPLGFDVDFTQLEYYGTGYPFLDRSKTSSQWQGADNANLDPQYVNSDGYPLRIPPGMDHVQQLINFELGNGPAGVPQQYVIETTKVDATISVGPSQVISNTVTSDGKKRRIVIQVDSSPFGNFAYMVITSLPTPFVVGTDTLTIVRLDEEASFKSGNIFTTQFKARFALVDAIRFMDWLPANRVQVYHWDQRPRPASASWNSGTGVPLEIQIALCNETKKDGWFHLSVCADDDYAVKTAAMIRDQLDPSLIAGCEFANENWNYLFSQYGYLSTLTPQIPGDSGDPSIRMAGYRSAALMGLMAKTFNFDPRFRPIWATQSVNAEVTRGNEIGIRTRMAEWANPAHPNYDPILANHFQEPGQLYTAGLMVTSYCNAGVSGDLTAADKAKVESWARADANGDSSGMAAFYDHWEHGTGLSTNSGSIAGYAATIADNVAIAKRLQMPMGAYEGQLELQLEEGPWRQKKDSNGNDVSDPNRPMVQAFFIKAMYDSRARGLFVKKLTAARNAGLSIDDTLSEFGSHGNTYGTLEGAYSGTLTAKGQGIQDWHNNPSPVLPLAIESITSDNDTRVNIYPNTRIITTGGLGRVELTVTGLAPGRVFDGFRTIKGTFTTTGTFTATVTATDQSGQSVSRTFDQVVGAAPVQPSGRYLRFVVYEDAKPDNRKFYTGLRAFLSNTADGVGHYATWTGDAQSNNPASILNGPNPNNADWSPDNLGNYANGGRIIGDLGSVMTLKTISLLVGTAAFAPAKFKVYLSSTPLNKDTDDGTLILDVNEPDSSNWRNFTSRDFFVDTISTTSAPATQTPTPTPTPTPSTSGTKYRYMRVTPTSTANGPTGPSSVYGSSEYTPRLADGTSVTIVNAVISDGSTIADNNYISYLYDGSTGPNGFGVYPGGGETISDFGSAGARPASLDIWAFANAPGFSFVSGRVDLSNDQTNWVTVFSGTHPNDYSGGMINLPFTYPTGA